MSFTADHLIPRVDEGPGNSAYLSPLTPAGDWSAATGRPLEEGS